MIDSQLLLADLKKQLKLLTADLRVRAEDRSLPWAQQLRVQHSEAMAAGRTAMPWTAFRDGEVDQAAVAWLIAGAFLRFCEDNHLLDGARTRDGRPVAVPWLAGPTSGPHGNRLALAGENETVFYRANPTANARDWMLHAFGILADLPAGRLLVDRRHNPVWTAWISAEAADALLGFWRRTGDDGSLVHDFTDPNLDTRFLGDLYQDLSEYAKKTFALLQTPVFVEELILDLTLEPALEEFGLEHLKLIDPTCGSGHFLLGAFARLDARWRQHAPNLDARQRVQRALHAIHGVDINPFAIAIARFRLTVAALQAAGEKSLVGAPAFDYHLAIGDSLLASQGRQGEFSFDDVEEQFTYAAEDVAEFQGILEEGAYHVVVGNPPYITVKDKALNQQYRAAYAGSTKGQYALSAPFMELFFRLARKAAPSGGAGFVGQITSNSFMKREFGTKVIENLLSGNDYANPVDLTHVLDTSGAYIPGHGTPTVILIGRRRRPAGDTVRAVLGKRGEPGQPADHAKGLVWTEIVTHLDEPGFDGTYVTVTNFARDVLSRHPWSLSGGGASDLKLVLDSQRTCALFEKVESIGFLAVTREDDAYVVGAGPLRRRGVHPELVRRFVDGASLRDWTNTSLTSVLCTYDSRALATIDESSRRMLWPLKQLLLIRRALSGTQVEQGFEWWEYSQLNRARYLSNRLISFAFVSTHNHFVLGRSGEIFIRSAPVIKLPAGATEDDYLDLLGVLNSSTACFWLKQVSHNKGNGGIGGGIGDEDWEPRYEFTGTKLQEFPLPAQLPRERARVLDSLAQELSVAAPAASLPGLLNGVSEPLPAVAAARERWESLRRRMIFEQEELDWEVYRLYGLLDEDLNYPGDGVNGIVLGERAFEIALARAVEAGTEETVWFERHGSTPITQVPASWPADYRAVIERRLELIASDPFISLLERPEYKRRWQTDGWDAQLCAALEAFILDRLEDPALWRDAADVVVRSVTQLANKVRHDTATMRAIALLTGSPDADVAAVIGKLMSGEAVPFLAAQRYTPSGLEKHAEWEKVWELQRREDAGEKVTIPVPPKYGPKDFRSTAIWRARGKLDVPKERFISYPGIQLPDDPAPVFGWAGWDHRDQAIALARQLRDQHGQARALLVAGLVELEAWLHQWHAAVDPRVGASPAETITTVIDAELAALHKTRADLRAQP